MSNCADFERLMEGMLAGDYEPGEGGAAPKWAESARRDLLAHVEGCAACKDLYGFHEWLAREAPRLEAPEPRELEAVRRNVLARIREEHQGPAAAASVPPVDPLSGCEPTPTRSEPLLHDEGRAASSPGERGTGSPWSHGIEPGGAGRAASPGRAAPRGSRTSRIPASGWSAWLSRPAPAAAVVIVLVTAGVFVGRATIPGRSAAGEGAGTAPGTGGDEALARGSGLPGQGLTGDTMESMEALPYSFTNVSVEPAGANLVRLTFDVTRRIRTERPQDDPLVREALKKSLRGASPLGDRLRALTLAGHMMDAEIREALIDTMRDDGSVAVRLRALETLSRYPADPDIQQAMLSVLTEEESVQMRLLAIDYLGASRVPPDRIMTAIEETQPDGAEALLVRATERLGL